MVAQQIAKCKKPHTIGEELILPAVVEMCEIMLEKEAANKLIAVPLSNDSVRRRIEDLSDDIESQLLVILHFCEQFSIQLDESTDIASTAQLIVLVRYGKARFWRTFYFARRCVAEQRVRKYSNSWMLS